MFIVRKKQIKTKRRDKGGGEGELVNPMASASGEEKAAGRVALHRLFAFADTTDAALMAVGAVAAVANGMAQPLMTFILGDVIDAFGSGTTDGVVHRVVQVRNNLATTT